MFTFWSDPGHGWLQVTLADVHQAGLALSDFTRYSYRKADTLFLEEDCDAGTFIKAYKAVHGKEPEFKEVHSNGQSFIRGLRRLG